MGFSENFVMILAVCKSLGKRLAWKGHSLRRRSKKLGTWKSVLNAEADNRQKVHGTKGPANSLMVRSCGRGGHCPSRQLDTYLPGFGTRCKFYGRERPPKPH